MALASAWYVWRDGCDDDTQSDTEPYHIIERNYTPIRKSGALISGEQHVAFAQYEHTLWLEDGRLVPTSSALLRCR